MNSQVCILSRLISYCRFSSWSDYPKGNVGRWLVPRGYEGHRDLENENIMWVLLNNVPSHYNGAQVIFCGSRIA